MSRSRLAIFLLIFSMLPGMAWGIKIQNPKEGSTFEGDRIPVIVAGMPGQKFSVFFNGIQVQQSTLRADGKADLLNLPCQPGPLKVEVLSDEAPVESDVVKMHVIGAPAKFELIPPESGVQAEGTLSGVFTLRITDAWGVPVTYPYSVSIRGKNAQVVTTDAAPGATGTQIVTHNGEGTFKIKGGNEVGDGMVYLELNNLRDSLPLDVGVPFLPMMVNGFIEGEGGYRNSQVTESLWANNQTYKKGFYPDGRFAFFGHGTIEEEYLLTVSYDSKPRPSRLMFRTFEPDRVYPIYGDASSIFYEAPTNSPLYVKLQRKRSYAQWGDFKLDLNASEYARYTRTFTGFYTKISEGPVQAQGFATQTDRTATMRVVQGAGISTYDFRSLFSYPVVTDSVPLDLVPYAMPLEGTIVPGSEQIRLEIHDRYHPERILGTTYQTIYVDYDIDYENAVVTFKQPVQSRDASDNPIWIVLTAEINRPQGKRLWLGGGQAGITFFDRVTLGGTGVYEQGDPQERTLLGGHTDVLLYGDMHLKGEATRTQSFGKLGWAYKVEANGRVFDNWFLNPYWRRVDETFLNPDLTIAQIAFGRGLLGTGYQKYGVLSSWTGFGAMVNLDAAKQVSISQELTTGRLDYTQKVSIVSLGLGGDFTRTKLISEGLIYDDILGRAKLAVNPITQLTLSAQRDQNFESGRAFYKPTSTIIGADFIVSPGITPFLRQEWAEFDTGQTQSWTTVGVTTEIGAQTRATAKYRVASGIDGMKNQASIGLNNKVTITKGLDVNLAYEQTRTLSGVNTGDFWAVSFGVEAVPAAPVRYTSKFERREDDRSISTMVQGGFDLTIDRSLTAIAKTTYRRSTGRGSESSMKLQTNLTSLGLAFRPTSMDWFNCLGKLENRYEQYSGLPERNTVIGSIEGIVEPISRWEIAVRYANKLYSLKDTLEETSSFTDLMILRTTFDMTKWWDVGAEGRMLSVHLARDYQYGMSAETGFAVFKDMRVGLGYNLFGVKDRDFDPYSKWAQGPYINFRLKFDEGWILDLAE